MEIRKLNVGKALMIAMVAFFLISLPSVKFDWPFSSSAFFHYTLIFAEVFRDVLFAAVPLSFIYGFLERSRTQNAIENATEKKIEQAEAAVRLEPAKPQAAWDLARTLLKSYVDKNIAQVQSIYLLTVCVMLAGFGLICFGIGIIYYGKAEVSTGQIAAISGILTEFVGVTFMLIYRSTMAQAQEYVAVLERINAVGMSIQILETVSDGENKLRDQTRVEIARDLLALYGSSSSKRRTNNSEGPVLKERAKAD